MILVDNRAGSDKLFVDLQKAGLPVQLDRLDGGDVMFLGRGPNSTEVTVGVEHKSISDLLSSLRSQRLQGHQLLEMQAYDFRFLIVEGTYRHDDDGFVTVRSGYREWKRAPGSFRASELDKTLLGLTLRAGVLIKETDTRRETVRWIQSLYRNFTDVEWDEHSSHTGVYRPAGLSKPSPFREFIMGIPGVGYKTSAHVEQFFRNPTTGKASPRRAVASRADVWRQIDGVGKIGAASIDAFLEGE